MCEFNRNDLQKTYEEIRQIYQMNANSISETKKQIWQVMYYSFAVFAFILLLVSFVTKNNQNKIDTLPGLVLLVFALFNFSVLFILKLHFASRLKLHRYWIDNTIREKLSTDAIGLMEPLDDILNKKIYEDAKISKFYKGINKHFELLTSIILIAFSLFFLLFLFFNINLGSTIMTDEVFKWCIVIIFTLQLILLGIIALKVSKKKDK